MHIRLLLQKRGIYHLWVTFLLLVLTTTSQAQSSDLSSPSPVRSNEVVGTIVARDLGDARLTDHFYALTGTPGDLVITLESRNLNGDVDLFTAADLRPLLKFTVYAESSVPTTKSIYLRKRESLILRVEARSPNDDEGTYHFRFGGSFEPISRAQLLGENENPTEQTPTSGSRPGKKGRRVSSVGARIEEANPPEAEVAAAPTPEPTPAETASATTAAAGASEKVAKGEARKTPASINRRSRTPARRTARTKSAPTIEAAKKSTEEAKEESKPVEVPKIKPAEGSEGESKPRTASRGSGRRGTAARSTTKSVPAKPEPEGGPRLIIETREGTLIDRFMNTVRRVTIENGQIVVVGKDGRVQRVQMAAVVRMSIVP